MTGRDGARLLTIGVWALVVAVGVVAWALLLVSVGVALWTGL